jgi:hypothetical protein
VLDVRVRVDLPRRLRRLGRRLAAGEDHARSVTPAGAGRERVLRPNHPLTPPHG